MELPVRPKDVKGAISIKPVRILDGPYMIDDVTVNSIHFMKGIVAVALAEVAYVWNSSKYEFLCF